MSVQCGRAVGLLGWRGRPRLLLGRLTAAPRACRLDLLFGGAQHHGHLPPLRHKEEAASQTQIRCEQAAGLDDTARGYAARRQAQLCSCGCCTVGPRSSGRGTAAWAVRTRPSLHSATMSRLRLAVIKRAASCAHLHGGGLLNGHLSATVLHKALRQGREGCAWVWLRRFVGGRRVEHNAVPKLGPCLPVCIRGRHSCAHPAHLAAQPADNPTLPAHHAPPHAQATTGTPAAAPGTSRAQSAGTPSRGHGTAASASRGGPCPGTSAQP